MLGWLRKGAKKGKIGVLFCLFMFQTMQRKRKYCPLDDISEQYNQTS